MTTTPRSRRCRPPDDDRSPLLAHWRVRRAPSFSVPGDCNGGLHAWARSGALGRAGRVTNSSRLILCPAGGDPSPRSPNRRTRSSSSPRCCGSLRSGSGRPRIAIDSSDNGHAMRPTGRPRTPSRWLRLAASWTTPSPAHVWPVGQGQVSSRPTKRGVWPRPESSSWRPAPRRLGRVGEPRTNPSLTTAPTPRRRPPPVLFCSSGFGCRGTSFYGRRCAVEPPSAVAAGADVERVAARRGACQVAPAAELHGPDERWGTPRPVPDLRGAPLVGQSVAEGHRRVRRLGG